MKNILLTFAIMLSFAISNKTYSQCYISANPDSITICEGDFVLLSSAGSCGYLLRTDFNNFQMGVGWASNASPMFTNPCPSDCDGTPYLWIGPASNFPRELVTNTFDVSTGGCQISFYMKYSIQGIFSPCEGPDLQTEGVHLQYSTSGTAGPWTDINYWPPSFVMQGNMMSSNTWFLITETIPPLASTANTNFRWFQTNTSGNGYDHWGLDNVEISCPSTLNVVWSHGPTTHSPPPVYPTSNTSYIVTISDSLNLNSASDTVYVTVNPNPSVQLSYIDSICTNEEALITYTGSASPLANYIWSFNGGTATPGTGVGPHLVNWVNGGTYNISLNVEENGCWSGISTFPINVNRSPVISFLPDVFSGCETLEIDFMNTSTPAIREYLWDFDDGTTSNIQNPTHAFNASGGLQTQYDIYLRAITTSGCKDSLILPNLITVYPQPIASFIADPIPARLSDPTINFTETCIGGATNWFWDFGEPGGSGINTAIGPTVVHTYDNEGSYNVTLAVNSSPSPCKDTTSFVIEILDDDLIFPNVITPNGDGVNDAFSITNIEKYDENRIDIYNKWGTRVYHAEPYLGDWEPENKSAATYYYVLYLGDKVKKNTTEYEGTVDVVVE